MEKNEFQTLDDFLQGRSWPKTKNSLRHLISKHKTEMLRKGIIKRFDKLWFISEKKFEEWVFEEKVHG